MIHTEILLEFMYIIEKSNAISNRRLKLTFKKVKRSKMFKTMHNSLKISKHYFKSNFKIQIQSL